MTRGRDIGEASSAYKTAVTPDSDQRLSEIALSLDGSKTLRYGENPNQPGGIYTLNGCTLADLVNLRLEKSGKGGWSATNLADVTRALDILKFFPDPTVAVMKHNIPSGLATSYGDASLPELYMLARDADARSAFGSVVVSNRSLDKETASEIVAPGNFVECVAAQGFEEGVMDVFRGKENLRVIGFDNLDQLPRFVGDDTKGLLDVKHVGQGQFLVQQPYLSLIRSVDDIIFDAQTTTAGSTVMVERDPTEREAKDMLTAWYVNLGVRSNGIVIVKDGVTLAVGTGQQERVGALEQAILKAYQKQADRDNVAHDPLHTSVAWFSEMVDQGFMSGAVVSSDGFFPFKDSIELASRVGITGVIQPAGSVNDINVIREINKNKMAMGVTLERCFGHF